MIPLIYNYIKHWFNRQDLKTKLFIVVCFIGLAYLMYLGAGKAYYKYKYFKQLETEVLQKNKRIEELENTVSKQLEIGEITTIKVKKSKIAIDKKLKEDEKIINNSTISDDDIANFIAKHQKR